MCTRFNKLSGLIPLHCFRYRQSDDVILVNRSFEPRPCSLHLWYVRLCPFRVVFAVLFTHLFESRPLPSGSRYVYSDVIINSSGCTRDGFHLISDFRRTNRALLADRYWNARTTTVLRANDDENAVAWVEARVVFSLSIERARLWPFVGILFVNTSCKTSLRATVVRIYNEFNRILEVFGRYWI